MTETMRVAVTVRESRPADAARIAAIYNEGIRDRVATFETAERTAEDVTEWLRGSDRPVLVAESSGTVVGWIAAYPYSDRECYRGIAEFSVYVASSMRGRRVGDTLMGEFLPACMVAGLSKIVSRIFPENAASLALCARHGFREVGVYERHARLDGEWRDVVIVERLLGVDSDDADPRAESIG